MPLVAEERNPEAQNIPGASSALRPAREGRRGDGDAERLAAAAGKEDASKADMHDPFTTFPSADA